MIITKHYCDRCKIEIKNPDSSNIIKTDISCLGVREGELVSFSFHDIELCEMCKCKLINFITGRKIEVRENGDLFLE